MPTATLDIHCGSCGATLTVEARHRTANCPYCDSASVVERPPSQDRPDPEFVLGFGVIRDRAERLVEGWIRSRGIFAHTSPIYVACGGEWSMFDEEAAKYMLTLIEGSLTYVREVAPMRQPGSTTHHHGEDDHMAYLERPFLEAQAAIHQRMHQMGLGH